MDKKTKLEQAKIWQRHKWFLTKSKEQFLPNPNELHKFIGLGVYFDQKTKYTEHNCEEFEPQKLGYLQNQLGTLISYKDIGC